VVDRYLKVRNFVPEEFWSIKLKHSRDGIDVSFNWNQNRLFDRAAVVILYERCLDAKMAKVSNVQEKPTSKWKPLPLTTVELQKNASRFLNMTGQAAMTAAESLYNKGFISYPRTETDIFSRDMNLKDLCAKQTHDGRWGTFAQNLVNGDFKWPRQGRHDDKAHPPIHPIGSYQGDNRSDEGRIYEFVVRRFLACCSEDAKGVATDIEVDYGPEKFHAHGVIIKERNYLDVYPYDKWTGNVLPNFERGESFVPDEALMTDGKTSPPGYLTEPDLIALMDANGIGTDATMAEHIEKIKAREYVITRTKHGGRASASEGRPARGSGSRGGRGGRGGGRGGSEAASGGGAGGGNEEFIPTSLGIALIEGYENIGFQEKLSKPFLRKELEIRLKDICEGRKTKTEVIREELGQYRRVYEQTAEQVHVLKQAARKYILGEGG
jgi:DNA topoisomerase-3